MNIEIYKQQAEQAKANIEKSYLELKVGDFVFADGCGLKNEGVAGLLYDMSNGDCLSPNRLCFIEKITHCKDADLISNKFEFGSGEAAPIVLMITSLTTSTIPRNRSEHFTK